MTYLLDVNACLALLVENHLQGDQAHEWAKKVRARGDSLAMCPLTELGFLRISTQPTVYNMPMEEARKTLQEFWNKNVFVPDDISAKDLQASRPAALTDAYLVELAHRRGMKLATFDRGISHPSVELIA